MENSLQRLAEKVLQSFTHIHKLKTTTGIAAVVSVIYGIFHVFMTIQ